jgi:hypothetical protein
MEIAHEVSKRLSNPLLEDNIGYFLLGSTSPDIRVITRRSREEYHFARLDFDDIGTGVRCMFESHPALRTSSDYEYHTQAFVAGYITHLMADEQWIVNMYRQYFGNPEVFDDSAIGNVMDRAMQLEMDRQAWWLMDTGQYALKSASTPVEIGFIPSNTIFDWRDWTVSFIERGFTWDRLRFMARRISSGDEAHPAHRIAEEFLMDVDSSLERLYDVVSRRDIVDYRERTVESLTEKVSEYLS